MGQILFKAIKRLNPVNAEAAPKFYPIAVLSSRVDNRAIIKYIAENSQVPAAHVSSALAAIEKTITNFVMNGHSVTIPSLGTFRPTLRLGKTQRFVAEAKQVDPTKSNLMVRFTPDSQLTDIKNYATKFIKL